MAVFSTNEFKAGLKVMLDGDPCSIMENEYVKPGKGQAFNRVKLRNLKTGRVLEKTFKSGEVLDAWTNPLTGARLDVLHILNDPVNRVYTLKGGPLAPPYPYILNGDRIVFQLDVLRGTDKSPMSRKEYPLHAQQDVTSLS